MDIFSHAIAGACTGSAFGRPVLGAVIAIIPDIPIFGPRRDAPSNWYKVTHSVLFLIVGEFIGRMYGVSFFVFSCLGSHIILDITTHGRTWYPRLFWPIQYCIYSGTEWEFFNRSWWIGAFLTILWCFLWLLIPK